MKVVKEGVFDPNNFCIDDILDEVKKARKKARKKRIQQLEKDVADSEREQEENNHGRYFSD